jgi:hypothetical protein
MGHQPLVVSLDLALPQRRQAPPWRTNPQEQPSGPRCRCCLGSPQPMGLGLGLRLRLGPVPEVVLARGASRVGDLALAVGLSLSALVRVRVWQCQQ